MSVTTTTARHARALRMPLLCSVTIPTGLLKDSCVSCYYRMGGTKRRLPIVSIGLLPEPSCT